jgi:single-stranded DNA-binding protein
MKDMNNSVDQTGRIYLKRGEKLPKLETKDGHAMTAFPLIVNEYIDEDEDGNVRESTTVMDVYLYREQAKNAVEYLCGGREVRIVGKLRSQTYQDRGENRRRLFVACDRIKYGPKPAAVTEPSEA